MIHFNCPHCGKAIKAGLEAAGRKGKCPGCGEIINVPYTAAVTHHNVLPMRKEGPSTADGPKEEPRAEVPQPQAPPPMTAAEQGEFWAEKVRRLKKEGCSDDVIRESRKNIPYPAAFREIAIAIRKDIRARRKENVDTRDLLLKLYQWAVIEDFFNRVEWSKIVDERILLSTARRFIKAIKAPYKTVGYANLVVRMTDGHGAHSFLPVLKKTDVNWLVEAFGEPDAHSTAQDANPELWQQAVEAFRAAAQRDEQQFYRSHGFDGPP